MAIAHDLPAQDSEEIDGTTAETELSNVQDRPFA
jgi:hypothetical protein